MHDICIIGDRDSVLGFKALGYTTYIIDNAYEAERMLEKIADDFAVIFIIEQYVEEIRSVIDRYRDKKLPAIIPVPGRDGTTGLSMRTIRDAMERAVGADILFKED